MSSTSRLIQRAETRSTVKSSIENMRKPIAAMNMDFDGLCDHVDELAKGKKREKITETVDY